MPKAIPPLDPRQRSTILHCLCVAAERFEEDAKVIQNLHVDMTTTTNQNIHRLREIFEKQAKDSRELWSLLSDHWCE